MAGGEHQPQQVIAEVVLEGVDVMVGVEGGLLRGGLARYEGDLAVEGGASAGGVDGAAFRGRHEPAGGVGWDTRSGPVLERNQERFLGGVLSETEVAGHACQPGDEAAGLDAPYGLDGGPRGGRVDGGSLILAARAAPDAGGAPMADVLPAR
jgi:hypothetical protein